MRTTKVSRTQTITKTVSKIGIKIDSHIRAGNMGCPGGVVKGEVRRGVWAMRRHGERARGRHGDTGAKLVPKGLKDSVWGFNPRIVAKEEPAPTGRQRCAALCCSG
jgi:hypothetical protein